MIKYYFVLIIQPANFDLFNVSNNSLIYLIDG